MTALAGKQPSDLSLIDVPYKAGDGTDKEREGLQR
jgi:hypothetical protein